jgi:hypothetical protein
MGQRLSAFPMSDGPARVQEGIFRVMANCALGHSGGFAIAREPKSPSVEVDQPNCGL